MKLATGRHIEELSDHTGGEGGHGFTGKGPGSIGVKIT